MISAARRTTRQSRCHLGRNTRRCCCSRTNSRLWTDRNHQLTMNPEDRLAELSLELPPAPKPVAVYKPLVICGGLAYVSGHGPLKADKTLMTGRVGAGPDLEAGQGGARPNRPGVPAAARRGIGGPGPAETGRQKPGVGKFTPRFPGK